MAREMTLAILSESTSDEPDILLKVRNKYEALSLLLFLLLLRSALRNTIRQLLFIRTSWMLYIDIFAIKSYLHLVKKALRILLSRRTDDWVLASS